MTEEEVVILGGDPCTKGTVSSFFDEGLLTNYDGTI